MEGRSKKQMDPITMVLLLVAATVAGAINAAVGSGSLLTLPVLMAAGLPPGVAVRTNTTGMVFSTVGAVAGYRKEIQAERPNLRPLSIATLIGAMSGSLLLLKASPGTLDIVVPILICVALVMVVSQPRLTKTLKERQARRAEAAAPGSIPSRESDTKSPYRRPALVLPMGLASIYGGFFTAAQGILYMAILSVGTGRKLGDVNAVKNQMSLIVNASAAAVYLVAHFVWGAEIFWIGTALVAIGSLIGGYFGAHLAKRLPDAILRGVIVVVAIAALARQLWG